MQNKHLNLCVILFTSILENFCEFNWVFLHTNYWILCVFLILKINYNKKLSGASNEYIFIISMDDHLCNLMHKWTDYCKSIIGFGGSFELLHIKPRLAIYLAPWLFSILQNISFVISLFFYLMEDNDIFSDAFYIKIIINIKMY